MIEGRAVNGTCVVGRVPVIIILAIPEAGGVGRVPVVGRRTVTGCRVEIAGGVCDAAVAVAKIGS